MCVSAVKPPIYRLPTSPCRVDTAPHLGNDLMRWLSRSIIWSKNREDKKVQTNQFDIIQKSSKNNPKSSKIYIVTFVSPKGFPGCFFLHHYIFRILFEHYQGRHLIISRSRRAVDLLERVAASATILLSLSSLILIKIQMFIPNMNGTEESHLLFSWVPAATSMKGFGAHKSSNWNAVLALTRKHANRTNILRIYVRMHEKTEKLVCTRNSKPGNMTRWPKTCGAAIDVLSF